MSAAAHPAVPVLVRVLGAVDRRRADSGDPSSSVGIDDLARRIINGEFGNIDARKRALGSSCDAVRWCVNEMLA